MKYVVRDGDTLYSISKKYYGKGCLWRFIVLVNLKSKPHNLEVGEEVLVPFA